MCFLPVGERWKHWANWLVNDSPEGDTVASLMILDPEVFQRYSKVNSTILNSYKTYL